MAFRVLVEETDQSGFHGKVYINDEDGELKAVFFHGDVALGRFFTKNRTLANNWLTDCLSVLRKLS